MKTEKMFKYFLTGNHTGKEFGKCGKKKKKEGTEKKRKKENKERDEEMKQKNGRNQTVNEKEKYE